MSWLKKLLGIKDELPLATKPIAKTQGSNFPPYTFSPNTSAARKIVLESEKRKLIDVDIPEIRGLYLIVHHPTGVEYTHQCAGTACFHPSLEGYLVPIEASYEAENELASYFLPAHSRSGLSERDAEDIDAIFKRHKLEWLCIAPNRLKDSYEAWIHVCIKPEYTWVPFCEGSDPRAEMVLIWQNSD